ncbi:MAG: hypothetical protein KatS3mg050_4047 [Litorilinea sp.]|nr:MAG: hypothetical protein KatS3mg050_4047 [Litorilinea sp.]
MDELRAHWEERYRQGPRPWDTGITPPEVVAFWQEHGPGNGGLALDLGCGTGTNVAFLARQGLRVLGFDYSGRALNMALQRIRRSQAAPPLPGCNWSRRMSAACPCTRPAPATSWTSAASMACPWTDARPTPGAWWTTWPPAATTTSTPSTARRKRGQTGRCGAWPRARSRRSSAPTWPWSKCFRGRGTACPHAGICCAGRPPDRRAAALQPSSPVWHRYHGRNSGCPLGAPPLVETIGEFLPGFTRLPRQRQIHRTLPARFSSI